MSKQFKQVVDFNLNILSIPQRELGVQDTDEFALSIAQLHEEIQEIKEAYHQGDFIGLLDGLIDLNYFLFGIMYKNGLTTEMYEQLFSAVHDCNSEKKLGVKATRQGFGDAADAIKPEGWVAPETKIQQILEIHNGKNKKYNP